MSEVGGKCSRVDGNRVAVIGISGWTVTYGYPGRAAVASVRSAISESRRENDPYGKPDPYKGRSTSVFIAIVPLD